ncbi:MAG TPA: DUF2059 domain-containing protein, partial [Syntrophobacteraceae bacterium]|nr:DUF2059 domain-containing protein [Syntrophobacteraceae bacterium]
IMEHDMRSKIYLWTIVLSLLPIVSNSQVQGNSSVRELYVKSGMEEQAEQLPSMMQAALDRPFPEGDRLRRLPRNVLSVMKASIPRAFAPERLREVMLAEFTRKLSDRDIKKLLQWFESPLGKKCVQLEEAASTAAGQAEIEKFAARLQDSPPTDGRLKVIRELDSAAKITDAAVDMAINMQVAFTLGMIAALPLEQQDRPDDVARELEETRPGVEAAVRSEIFICNLYTYRSLSDAEIKRYTQFAKSPAGSKFNLVGTAALKKAMNEGAVKWGKLIGDAIKEMGGNSEA